MTLATAYGAIQGTVGQGTSSQLAAIQSALSEIRYALDRINDSLHVIQLMLTQLPKAIRGEVDNSLFQASMGAARSMAGEIRDYSAEEVIDSHQNELANALQILNEHLGAIKGVKGVRGVFLSSGLLAIWLSGSLALEKSRMRTQDGYQPLSPWSRDVMQSAYGALTVFKANVIDTEDIYDQVAIPQFPNSMETSYMFVESDGTRMLRRRQPPLNGPQTGDYRIMCREGSRPERLQNRLIDHWVDVSGPLELQLLGNVQSRRSEMLSFCEFVPEWKVVEAPMFEVFNEPAGVWS